MSFHDILYSPANSWRLNDASVVSGSIFDGNAPPSANPLHAPGFFTIMGIKNCPRPPSGFFIFWNIFQQTTSWLTRYKT